MLVAAGLVGCDANPHGNAGKSGPKSDPVVLKPELLQPLVMAAKPEKTLSVPEAMS